MVGFFSYVPIADLTLQNGEATLLKSAASEAALLADPTYDPDQVGSRDIANIADTGTRQQVTNTKTGDVVSAAVCSVS
jgi:hypothetical protein